jgi:nucleoside phosphorylase
MKEATCTVSSVPIVVLLTVNDHETHAVFDAFWIKEQFKSETRGGITYNLFGNHGGMQIVHTISEMGAGGIGAAQQRTQEAIKHWSPQAVIAVGIAFGLDESKQQIGNVLVATQLQEYDLSRINHDGTITPRGDKSSTSDTLLNRLRQCDAIQRRQSENWPDVRFGLVLSGQKLVDNIDYRDSLKRMHGEAVGGEMEGSGLYVSATQGKVDWIVVKAICDWGHDKQHSQKDQWQILASKNAAQVIKTAIDMGNLYFVGQDKSQSIAKFIGSSNNVIQNAGTQENTPLHNRRNLWFNSTFRVDRVAVAAFVSAAVHKNNFNVEIIWPSELLNLAERVRQILDEIQSASRPAKLNTYSAETLANFVLAANEDLVSYEKIINNAAKRVALMTKGVLPYYRFVPSNLIENFLALCVLKAGRHLFRYAAFEPYRDDSLCSQWDAVLSDDYGKELQLLMECKEEVYAAHLDEISGYKLDGYAYFYGPASLVTKTGQYREASVHNSWFPEWIIPQLELFLAYNESSEIVTYNEKVHICKIRDENFEQI